MDPVTAQAIAQGAAGAIQIGMAIKGYYDAEKARKASRKRLDEIQRMWDAIKPPEYDLSLNDPPNLFYQRIQSPEFQASIGPTDFDPRKIQQLEEYAPQISQFIKEVDPTLYKESEAARSGLESQKDALQEYARISNSTDDPRFRELIERASRRAAQDAQSRQKGLMQNYQRRGLGGSGFELAAQIGSEAAANDTQAEQNMAGASQAYQNRLAALAAGSNLGGTLRSQDMTQQQINMNAINDFNRRLASSRQAHENLRTGLLNEASRYNIGERQRLEEINRNREDRIRQINRGERVSERDRLDDLLQRRYQNEQGERGYRDQLELTRYNVGATEKDRMNALRRQKYLDDLERTQGSIGIKSNRDTRELGYDQARIRGQKGLGDLTASLVSGKESSRPKRRYEDEEEDDQQFIG